VPTNTPIASTVTLGRTLTPVPAQAPLPTDTRVPTPTEPSTAGIEITRLRESGRDEYVEITNHGSPQDLTGWLIVSVRGDQRYQFPRGYVLFGGGAVRVHSGPGASGNPPMDLFWTRQYMWHNAGDRAMLFSAQGSLVDEWGYEGY
jgi:hypothetical protein